MKFKLKKIVNLTITIVVFFSCKKKINETWSKKMLDGKLTPKIDELM